MGWGLLIMVSDYFSFMFLTLLHAIAFCYLILSISVEGQAGLVQW
jgi:hypothetical protein